ncbi:hypothetical protein ACFOEK_10515 [Litoribrevibacter euphylliae]|uniref:GST N-terminal domain-containing protein n=1 Tax=Litoribrevibacter euphylliae TaxID=1834034 RepID=A0ABV7HC14_9GAMM
MTLNIIDFETAKTAKGLRMTAVRGIPSPWTEAAKGILCVKGIDYHAVYHDPFSKEMAEWAGSASVPAIVYNDETPVSDWRDILALAERLNPDVPLLPNDEASKGLVLEYAKLMCGKQGLGWYSRLQKVHKGLLGEEGGYSKPIAQYLASKYGYNAEDADSYTDKVIDLLTILSTRLKEQQASGKKFYEGDTLTAADIYSTTFIGYFNPLPEEQCQMLEPIRKVFEQQDQAVLDALDPVLIEHRDFIYSEFLELPVSL